VNKPKAIIGEGRHSLPIALLAMLTSPQQSHTFAIRRQPDADGFDSHDAFYPYPRFGKPERASQRCALPGCVHDTTHKGGYCCADHCREHRQRQRAANISQRVKTSP
jgi:hypothetical protein